LLRDENAKVFVSDINDERTRQVSKKYGAEAVSNNSIFDIDADIYAPCALGATINTQTIGKLKCGIIAGSANDQLQDELYTGKCCLIKEFCLRPIT
jgi:leucine dehydrogenase